MAMPGRDDVLAAFRFAISIFNKWAEMKIIDPAVATKMAQKYATEMATFTVMPGMVNVDLPPLRPGPKEFTEPLRCWTYLIAELGKHEETQTMPLADCHAAMQEAQSRANYLITKINQTAPQQGGETPILDTFEQLLLGKTDWLRDKAAKPEAPTGPPKPRRSVMELLLDPRSIQWFLAFGGGLFVLGLVLWLWSAGVFENNLVVASCLGAANLVCLLGGWFLLLRTRYHLAGRALTLLAALVMPLNLWFYHAQNLVTLEHHLWVAGVIVCVLYLATALVLKDAVFVPVLMGGIVMTGLLLLADLHKFWEIIAPSSFLVILGLIAIHVERAFAPDDGPFSRKRFGLSFFFSGQVIMLGGLLLLLGAQLAGDLLFPWFENIYRYYDAEPSPVAVTRNGRLIGLGLVCAAMYGYIYSDIVVRRLGLYLALAVGCLLWAIVVALRVFELELGAELIVAALALTALAAHVAFAAGREAPSLTRFAPFVGSILTLSAVAIAAVLHVRATSQALPKVWQIETGWPFVGAAACCVLAARVGAHVFRERMLRLSRVHFFASALAELIFIAGVLRQFGWMKWEQQAWVLMLVPIAHALAAHTYRGRPWAGPVLSAGQFATAIMLIASLLATLRSLTAFERGEILNWQMAAFFALASVFYFLTATLHRQRQGPYLATLLGTAAIWQVLLGLGVHSDEVYIAVFAVLGLLLLIAYRLGLTEKTPLGKSAPLFACGNVLLSMSFMAAILMGVGRLTVERNVDWTYVGLCSGLTLAALAAVALVRQTAWRRWYVLAAVALGIMTALSVEHLLTIPFWRKVELFFVAGGLILYVSGLMGWFREQERHDDLVGLGLGFGSLLIAFPVAASLLWHRCQGGPNAFSWFDEILALTAAIGLLGTGFVCQVRWPTIIGAALLALYLVTLLILARELFAHVHSVAKLLALGGGLIFLFGVMLAVFRDRLKQLPERVRERRGIFRVLDWR